MGSRQNNKKYIVITVIVLVVIAVVLGVIGYLYMQTNAFKSSEEMFQTYFLQNLDIINNVTDFDKETEYVKTLEENDFDETTQIEFKYIDSENNEETFTGSITGTNSISTNKKYKDIKINSSDIDVLEVEYLKEDQIYGLHFVNIADKYATIDFSNNVSNILAYFGLEDSISADNINEIKLSDVFTLSDDEKTELEQNYVSIILSQISKNDYSSQTNKLITLSNGQSVTTNAYVLSLDEEQVNTIYANILEELYQDEIILEKLENIDNSINQMGITLNTSVKDEYLNYIKEKQNNLNTSNGMTITVYEQDGTNVRTTVEYGDKSLQIDINNSNTNDITIKYSNIVNNIIQETTVSIAKSSDGNWQISYEDYNNTKFEITRNLSIDENDIQSYTKFSYSGNEDISEIDITIDRNITTGTSSEITASFDSVGKIVLNDYDDEALESALSSLKEKIVTSLREKRDQTNSSLIDSIIQYNNDLEENEKAEAETAKNLFNSKFELYEGESLDEGIISNLLDEVGENMSNYQSVGENKIKIYIEEGKENKELVEEIKTNLFGEENSQTSTSSDYKYNVSFEYDDTGRITQVIIETVEDEEQ